MGEIEGYHYQTNDYINVKYENGIIKKIALNNQAPKEDRKQQIIAPGFFDIQINGFGGVDFNSLKTTPKDILNITNNLNRKGTLKYLPTIITNTFENILSLLETIKIARETYSECESSIVGVHLEGPFLSREDGPRGAHPLSAICPPDWKMVEAWQKASGNLIKIITLSPEYDTAEEVISYCCQQDIKVSIGHTSANRDQILSAVNAGATLSTHLGNGSHTMLPRHNNYIWNQLASDQLYCSIIGDGIHLPKDVLKCFFAIKQDKAILISDSSEIAGLKPGIYESHIGGVVLLTAENRLCMADNPELLAGSAATLFDEIRYLTTNQINSLKNCLLMATVRPAKFLGYNNDLIAGNSANLIVIEEKINGELGIKKIIKEGTSII